MLTLHLPRLLPLTLGLTLGGATILTAHSLLTSPPRSMIVRCDAAPAASVTGALRDEYSRYTSQAKTPVVTRDGRLNGNAVKEFTKGSIAGLLGGVAVGVFSKSLALILGLLVLGVQGLESRGIHIIPYGRIQSMFKSTDIRSALEDNVAFKVSFGLAFALAGFMEF